VVLRAGEVVEEGPTDEVIARPSHPYTRALIAAVPDIASGLRRRSAL
jgi:peptide/nickel transport system ATP-binding protein